MSNIEYYGSKNIIFDSNNGSIHASVFIQSQHMNGIKNGYIEIRHQHQT